MVLNDTLANALSIISQYEKLGRKECKIQPSSKIILEALRIMKEFGYVKDFQKITEGMKDHVIVQLHGRVNGAGVIKPRFAVKTANFEKWEKRFLPSKDMGILLVSTTQGMMDHGKAKQNNIGGRVIAYCY